MEKVLDDDLENAATIRKALLENELENDWRKRYKLLRMYFKSLRPRMDPDAQNDGDQALNLIMAELKKQESGSKDSNFMTLSDEFENELNDFIEKKINRR